MWTAVEIVGVLIALYVAAVFFAGIIGGRRAEVDMSGGETIVLPPKEPEPAPRRRWRITIERS